LKWFTSPNMQYNFSNQIWDDLQCLMEMKSTSKLYYSMRSITLQLTTFLFKIICGVKYTI